MEEMIDFKKNNNWIVYVHISPTNKYYVGITSQKPNNRWKNGKGYIKNTYFYRSIQKYGWENFKHEIIAENLTKQEACNFEKILIKKLGSNNYYYGYNLSSGGEYGASGLLGEKNPNYGHHWTDEMKQKMSEVKKNSSHEISDELRKKYSELLKLRWENEEYRFNHSGINASCYGRTKEKHPMYKKRGSDNPNSKKVICLNTLEVFDSAVEASNSKSADYSKLCMCCRNKRATSGKDKDGNLLTWMYYSDYIKSTPNFIENKLQKAKRNLQIKNSNTFVVNLNTKELFSSIKNASKYYNKKDSSLICKSCKNNSKKAYGYYWQYYEDYLIQNNLIDIEARKNLSFII